MLDLDFRWRFFGALACLGGGTTTGESELGEVEGASAGGTRFDEGKSWALARAPTRQVRGGGH